MALTNFGCSGKMNNLINKIGLSLKTFRHAHRAIGRQYDPDSITRVQNAKLRRLVQYCFDNIKYYREQFTQAGVSVEKITSAEHLVDLPILTKQQLRERWWDFLPRELPACRVSRTSGSTGIPVCILSDSNSRMFNSAAVIRYRCALGMKFFSGDILTPLKTPGMAKRDPHRTFLQGVHKTYYINPYSDTAEYARRLFSSLKNPTVIGITPAIRALAYKIRDGIFPCFQPRVVVTSGETLEPNVRTLIESAFGAKVADVYACNEAGDVAWQCRLGGGYHVNAENVIVEILKDDKPVCQGEIGEVAITNLNRFAMPIVRYKNGDRARLSAESCPCGCKLPMIGEILGRTGEDITLPDGRTVAWNQLKSLMNHPWVRQFQLVQNKDASLTVRYAGDKAADTTTLEHLLLYRLKNLLGDSISVTAERCDEIATGPAGKTKLVISYYNND